MVPKGVLWMLRRFIGICYQKLRWDQGVHAAFCPLSPAFKGSSVDIHHYAEVRATLLIQTRNFSALKEKN